LRGSDRKSLPGEDCYNARSRSKPCEARSSLPEAGFEVLMSGSGAPPPQNQELRVFQVG